MASSSERPRTSRDDDEVERERLFVDSEGIRWQVREMPFSSYDRRSGRSLIFWSDGAVRRVRDYPADWHLLSDGELAKLSWKT
jgi:hypothetical protein